MKLYTGHLDYKQPWELPNILLFTGNPVKKNNGAIVMGAGAAKTVRDAYIGIDKRLGDAMKPNVNLLFVPMVGTQYIGWFKVKHHWRDDADLALVYESSKQLAQLAKNRPELQFHMNYPAIGNGKLTREQVEPYLQDLPDNVHLYI